MPSFEDLAALPTSWALTLWDALPLFVSIEVAIAICVIALVGGKRVPQMWKLSDHYVAAGLVYLLLFDLQLALVFLGSCVIAIRFPAGAATDATPIPDSPLSAIRVRGGEVAWDVAKAGAIAAVVKVLLTPMIPSGSWIWVPVALAGGVLSPWPIGASAIPALAANTAAGSLLAGTVWLVAAALQPQIRRFVARRAGNPAPDTTALHQSKTE